jgi:hypothetical protein
VSHIPQVGDAASRGVGVPIPQGAVPKEREPIFKSIFIDVFEMIESSHTLLLSLRGNLLWAQGY